MNYLVYDCEIVSCIPPRNGVRADGLKYCEGWRDFENMGISVICASSFDLGLNEVVDYRLVEDDSGTIAQKLQDIVGASPTMPIADFDSQPLVFAWARSVDCVVSE